MPSPVALPSHEGSPAPGGAPLHEGCLGRTALGGTGLRAGRQHATLVDFTARLLERVWRAALHRGQQCRHAGRLVSNLVESVWACFVFVPGERTTSPKSVVVKTLGAQ